MEQIWVVGAGEYEGKYVSFVASSPEAAFAHLKAEYPQGNWVYTKTVKKDVMRDGKVYVKGWTDHTITGRVLQNPAMSLEFFVPVEYDLSQVDFAREDFA